MNPPGLLLALAIGAVGLLALGHVASSGRRILQDPKSVTVNGHVYQMTLYEDQGTSFLSERDGQPFMRFDYTADGTLTDAGLLPNVTAEPETVRAAAEQMTIDLEQLLAQAQAALADLQRRMQIS